MWKLFVLLITFVSCQARSMPYVEKRLPTCTRSDSSAATVGQEWTEGSKSCNCIIPESLIYFWNGQNPSPPIIRCKTNGCPSPNGSVLKDGSAFNKGSDICICKRGTNPMLADASTLYHAICFSADSGHYINVD